MKAKTMWMLLLGLTVVAVGVAKYGQYHWNSKTSGLYRRLELGQSAPATRVVDFSELASLPAPVQRYFHRVLKDGQPIIKGVHVQHQGTFNMGETADQWKPFSSDQRVATARPGFVWNGRVQVLPGVPVYVHDAYVAGEGILHATLLGLIEVVSMQGKADIAEGELMRFFAEAAWYPTALLPSQGVQWEEVNDRSAKATLDDGSLTLTMLFTFNEQGLIDTVSTERRGRTVGGKVIPTPWEGRFWDYQEHEGMLIPFNGEVSWLLPEGKKPYWRGSITHITYELTG